MLVAASGLTGSGKTLAYLLPMIVHITYQVLLLLLIAIASLDSQEELQPDDGPVGLVGALEGSVWHPRGLDTHEGAGQADPGGSTASAWEHVHLQPCLAPILSADSAPAIRPLWRARDLEPGCSR